MKEELNTEINTEEKPILTAGAENTVSPKKLL